MSFNFRMQDWFVCYEARKSKVICKGPFKTAFEADDATPKNGTNTTLLPACSILPTKLQGYLLQMKYNKIFYPGVTVYVDKDILP